MSYIGRTPQIGAYSKLDAITTDGSASYTMQLNSANFVPESVNHLIVSVNGVIQAPTDSFTVSGSTITFASSLSASDTIDFIMALGNVLDIGVPSDNTVSLSKLTASGTKDATTFLRGDNTFAAAGGGKVLQVLSTTKTDTFSTSSTSFVDVTGLSVSITPSSASNKILIIASIYGGNDTQYSFARLMRDATPICIGDANGDNTRCSFTNFYTGDGSNFKGGTQNYLDSPSTTSSITYKIQMLAGSGTVYLNYGGAISTVSSRARVASTITVMEIGA